MSDIAIVGQGVIGLTTAEVLIQAGHRVTIYSKDDNEKTASYGAGAYWWPHKAWPPERIKNWSSISYNRYRSLSSIPESGITMHKHYRYAQREDETRYALDITEQVHMISVQDLDFPAIDAFECTVPVMDVPVFMPWLRSHVASLGAQFKVMSLISLSELENSADYIINCSGLGARELVNDPGVYPIRGQVVRLAKDPSINHSYRMVHHPPGLTLVLPRSNDLLLGGTVDENNESLSATEAETREIIERCSHLVPEIKHLEVLGASAALRPGRAEVRLEIDYAACKIPVIHNYGHGGSGYTIAYGCAEEVAALVETNQD
jgi:D-amino-acid oxidase